MVNYKFRSLKNVDWFTGQVSNLMRSETTTQHQGCQNAFVQFTIGLI